MSSLEDGKVVEAQKEKVDDAKSASEEGELGEIEPGEEPSEKAKGQQPGDDKSRNSDDAQQHHHHFRKGSIDESGSVSSYNDSASRRRAGNDKTLKDSTIFQIGKQIKKSKNKSKRKKKAQKLKKQQNLSKS